MVKTVWRLYKGLESSLSLFEYGVFSLSLSLVVGGVAQYLSVLLGGAVSLPVLLIYLSTVCVKLGGVFMVRLSERDRKGHFSKTAWAYYSLLIALASLLVVLIYAVFFTVSWIALVAPVGMLAFTVILFYLAMRP